jgi:hypothetical protein
MSSGHWGWCSDSRICIPAGSTIDGMNVGCTFRDTVQGIDLFSHGCRSSVSFHLKWGKSGFPNTLYTTFYIIVYTLSCPAPLDRSRIRPVRVRKTRAAPGWPGPGIPVPGAPARSSQFPHNPKDDGMVGENPLFEGSPVRDDTEDDHCTGKDEQCNQIRSNYTESLSPEDNSSECMDPIIFGIDDSYPA